MEEKKQEEEKKVSCACQHIAACESPHYFYFQRSRMRRCILLALAFVVVFVLGIHVGHHAYGFSHGHYGRSMMDGRGYMGNERERYPGAYGAREGQNLQYMMYRGVESGTSSVTVPTVAK